MADFCQQCSIEAFGEDFKDLADLGPADDLKVGHGWFALCEDCGPTVVDQEGQCISKHCDKKHGEKQC